jgi:glucose-1-phosphate thymidylyltransferase
MKSLILTAGEGTRLRPITWITPKPLLDVKGKPVLDYIVSSLDSSKNIEEIYIIYPNLFEYQFNQFEKYFKYGKKIEFLSDKHRVVNEMPGSIGAIAYVVKHKNIQDDLLVIGGDNLIDFSIDDFVAFYESKGKKTSIAVYDIGDKQKVVKKFGCVEIDKNKKIISFEEKPIEPKSSLISTLCYILSKHDLHHLNKNIFKENAGELIQHLVNNGGVYAFEFKGKWFDIGRYEDLEKAREEF